MDLNKESNMLKNLIIDITEVTEVAAIASYDFFGLGDEYSADKAAVTAMRDRLNKIQIDGCIVIGEGERDKAPMLFIGEKLGTGGQKIDIAVDPLEGTTILANGNNNAVSVIAIAETGHLLNAPDVYMDKIAIGLNFPERIIDLSNSPRENLRNIAIAKKTHIEDLIVTILDRPRHEELIAMVRESGAQIRLISDGDIMAVIETAMGFSDMYIGVGGAPEGVLAATALKTIGGQICGKLLISSEEDKNRATKMGITNLDKEYYLEDMVKGEVIFAATGVTDGSMLHGVSYSEDTITTESLVIYSGDKTIRKIATERSHV